MRASRIAATIAATAALCLGGIAVATTANATDTVTGVVVKAGDPCVTSGGKTTLTATLSYPGGVGEGEVLVNSVGGNYVPSDSGQQSTVELPLGLHSAGTYKVEFVSSYRTEVPWPSDTITIVTCVITTATPTSPTQTTVVGAGNDTITPPTITGVVYTCDKVWRDVNGVYTVTCTAAPAPGHQLPAGVTTTWTFTDGAVPTTDTWTYGSWDQKHGADKLPCATGGHWVLTGQGITAAQVKVGGKWVAMTQNGQGSWSYTSTGTVTSTTVLEYRYQGDPKNSVFTLSSCTTSTPSPTTSTPSPTTSTPSPTTSTPSPTTSTPKSTDGKPKPVAPHHGARPVGAGHRAHSGFS